MCFLMKCYLLITWLLSVFDLNRGRESRDSEREINTDRQLGKEIILKVNGF